jgi:hypothetical protein
VSVTKAVEHDEKVVNPAVATARVVTSPQLVPIDPATASGANTDGEAALGASKPEVHPVAAGLAAAASVAPGAASLTLSTGPAAPPAPHLGEVGIPQGADMAGELELPGRSFRDDPRLDRRIIEGMLGDREIFLEGMAQEGFSPGAVLRRAAELGLSEAMVRQVKGVAADLAGERPGRRAAPTALGARTCLSCDRIFLSSGPGNRLCMRCRGGDAGMAQL